MTHFVEVLDVCVVCVSGVVCVAAYCTTTHFVEVLDIIDLLREGKSVKVSCYGVRVVGVKVCKESVDKRINVIYLVYHAEKHLHTYKQHKFFARTF